MKRITSLLAAMALAMGYASMASAAEIVKSEEYSINVDGRLQLLGVGQRIDDPFRDSNRMYMFVRQARVNAEGEVDGFKFRVQVGFAGEDEVKAPSPGVSLGLLDIYADIPLQFLGDTHVRVGQFKMPYSLERLADSGTLAFTDRSIQNVAFRMGRDYGVAVHSNLGNVKGAVGVFSGGGRDVPERYLPMILGIPMVTARVGYDSGLYENAFAEEAQSVEGAQFAAFVNGFYLQDTQIGHSSVLNVRLGERSLLINGSWNPYLGMRPTARGHFYQVGGDVAGRLPMGTGALVGELELNHGAYENEHGRLAMTGGRAQLGYHWSHFEATVRYAVVRPDENMSIGGVAVTGGKLMNEVTPAIAWNYSRNVRLFADLPILVNAPVVTEQGLGDYILTEQPDQASYLKPNEQGVAVGTASRKNVVAARLMLQAQF